MSKILTGGYAQIDLTSPTIYDDVKELIGLKKFVVVEGDGDIPYIADSIKLDDVFGFITITKGGRTIDIANDNTCIANGDIQPHLYLYRIDLADRDSSDGDGTIISGQTYVSFISNIPNLDSLENLDSTPVVVTSGVYEYDDNALEISEMIIIIENNNLTINEIDDNGDAKQLENITFIGNAIDFRYRIF